MTDLPLDEREAMEAIARRHRQPCGNPQADMTFACREGWLAAREYSKQREEKLAEALRRIVGNIERDGYASPALAAIAEVARAALAENGDSDA